MCPRRKVMLPALSSALVFLTSSCGGSADSGHSDAAPHVEAASTQLKGVVVDGYLVGAKVCLDLNANWICDGGEPATFSKDGGRYTLDVAPLKAEETRDKLVIAEVGPDVKDEAIGKTLKEQGLAGYVLATRGGQKPVLSPINTLHAAKYFNDGLKDEDEQNLADLLQQNGLSGTVEDFFDPDAPLSSEERILGKRSGTVLAAALANAQEHLRSKAPAVYGNSGAALGFRSARVLTQALMSTRQSNRSETEAELLDRIKQKTLSLELSVEQEKLLQRPATILSTGEALGALSRGLYDPSMLGGTPRNLMALKADGEGGRMSLNAFVYRNGAWVVDSEYNTQGAAGYHVAYNNSANSLTPSPVTSLISVQGPVLTSDGKGGLVEKFSLEATAPSHDVKLISRDLAGLNFNALPALSNFSGVFSSGHRAYRLRKKAMVQEYVFDAVAPFFSSLEAFRSSPRTCHAGICWVITRQPNNKLPDRTGAITFTTTSSEGGLNLGEGECIEEVIAGVNVLLITSVPIEVQNRSVLWSAKDGRSIVFATIDNKLWMGRFTQKHNVWFSDWLLAPDAINAVLAAAQLGEIAHQ